MLRTGLLPSLIQGPLSRFGDTAANDGVQAALAAMQVFFASLPRGMTILHDILAQFKRETATDRERARESERARDE